MHSRIIELSKDPILKNERMCESSVPDWFYHSIADYTDADTDRDHDIKCILRRSAATGAVISGRLATQRPPVIRWSF